MAYEDDPLRDEDGEALMNYDDFQSDGEGSPQHHEHHHLLDDEIPDDDDDGAWRSQHRSPTPVFDTDPSATKSKPRKRLIRKSHANTANEDPITNFVVDEVVDDGFVREEGSVGGKRKKLGGSGKKEKRHVYYTLCVREHSPGDASQAEEGEEDEEIYELFKMGKKKKRRMKKVPQK